MKNLALCIGCDDYWTLSTLDGAEADAKRIHDYLKSTALYGADGTRLLLSPTLLEAREAVDEMLMQHGLGVVSFYFAGHGGIKAGTFYLCLKDSDAARLSTTALPVADLFAVIGESQPRQANFVIDACQSGGAMYDLHALMKPDAIGQAGSSSVAFLAASASNQYAGESESGGISTTALLRYMKGEKKVQESRPYLDLIELGRAVSRDVAETAPDQTPVAWGLNLYGDGVFTTNPFYTGESSGPAFPVDGIAPATAVGAKIQGHAEALWSEYRLVLTEHNPSRMRATLSAVRDDLGDDYSKFVRGFATTLSTRAAESHDLLAGSEALAACAVSLLPKLGDGAALAACQEILRQRASLDHHLIGELCRLLSDNEYALLSESFPLADLHYLPMRLLRVLAWATLSSLADTRLGLGQDADAVKAKDLTDTLLRVYEGSLVSVSDEQASWAFILATGASELGWSEVAGFVLDRLFASGLLVRGRFSQVGASGEEALRYTLARAGVPSPVAHHELANPSGLLSVMLLCGHRLGRNELWNPLLETLDGRSINAYVPDDYRIFGDEIMRGGQNYTQQIGYGVWTLEEYAAFFEEEVAPHALRSQQYLGTEGKIVCGLAAYLFPDRIPYPLETTGPASPG